jgi:hypothetical protein
MAEDRDLSDVSFFNEAKAEKQASPREEMLKILRDGGTTMHKGQHIRSVADIPSDAELAKGDPEAAKQAEAILRARLEDAQKQLALLSENSKSEEPKEEAKEAPKAERTSAKK